MASALITESSWHLLHVWYRFFLHCEIFVLFFFPFCMLDASSTHPLAPIEPCGGSLAVFWVSTRGLGGETLQKVRSLSLGHLWLQSAQSSVNVWEQLKWHLQLYGQTFPNISNVVFYCFTFSLSTLMHFSRRMRICLNQSKQKDSGARPCCHITGSSNLISFSPERKEMLCFMGISILVGMSLQLIWSLGSKRPAA